MAGGRADIIAPEVLSSSTWFELATAELPRLELVADAMRALERAFGIYARSRGFLDDSHLTLTSAQVSSFIGEIAAILTGVESVMEMKRHLRDFVASMHQAFQCLWLLPSLPKQAIEQERLTRSLMPELLKLSEVASAPGVTSFKLVYRKGDETIKLSIDKKAEAVVREKVLLLLGDETFEDFISSNIKIINRKMDIAKADLFCAVTEVVVLISNNGEFYGILDNLGASNYMFRESRQGLAEDFTIPISEYCLVDKNVTINACCPHLTSSSRRRTRLDSGRKNRDFFVVLDGHNKPVGYVSGHQIAQSYDFPDRYKPY